jgi:hypothetical protein
MSALTLLWLLENAFFQCAEYLVRRSWCRSWFGGFGGYVVGAAGIVLWTVFWPFTNGTPWPYGSRSLTVESYSWLLSGLQTYFGGVLLAFLVHHRAAVGATRIPCLASFCAASLLILYCSPIPPFLDNGQTVIFTVFYQMSGLSPIFALLVLGVVESTASDGPLDPLTWLLSQGWLPSLGRHFAYTTYIVQAPINNLLQSEHMRAWLGYPGDAAAPVVYMFLILLPAIFASAAILEWVVQRPAAALYGRFITGSAAASALQASTAKHPASV